MKTYKMLARVMFLYLPGSNQYFKNCLVDVVIPKCEEQKFGIFQTWSSEKGTLLVEITIDR